MIDTKNIPEAKCLLDFCDERIFKKQKGTIMIFTGGSGDGKSNSGLRFLELWYKDKFNEDFPLKHICNDLEESILIVRNFKRAGEGILIEELSVHAGKRDALTTSNKLWNNFVDICRKKKAIIIGNCPHITFIDSHFQMMCHVWVNCEKVNFEEGIVIAHPLWLQTSQHKKEPYKHKFINSDGDAIDFCYFKLPTEHKEYEQIKDDAQDEIFDEIILKMRNNRIKKLKQLGQRVLPKREMEAYIHALNGLSSEEAAKEMGLKDEKTYERCLKKARAKLRDPKYSHFLRKSAEFDEKEEKGGKRNKKNV